MYICNKYSMYKKVAVDCSTGHSGVNLDFTKKGNLNIDSFKKDLHLELGGE